MIPRFLRPSLLAPFAALALGLGTGVRAADPIKIGEVASLTGKEATFGQSSHKGTLLAIEELNAAGGVLGRPLVLLTEDNQSQAGEAVTAATKLVAREKVVALLGEVASGRSLAMAPIAQRYRVPMISPSSTNPDVTAKGTYVFRVCFIDPFQGTVMATFAKNTLQARKIAILTDVSAAYSVGLAKFFRERFLADGGTIVADQKYSGGDKDFKAQLTAIRAAAPDAIFVPAYYTEAALIAVQARELGLKIPLFGGDGWESAKLIEIGGAAVEGCFYSTHYAPDVQTPAVQAFVAKFKQRFAGEVPDAMAALGYDSALVLADAIKRAGTTDGPALRDALAATKNFPGVTGATTMDAERNAQKAAVILEIKGGQFVFRETVAP